MKGQRPTIALAMIIKNEAQNLPHLLHSVFQCFDEIHITDTGSTDESVSYLQSKQAEAAAGCPIYVHNFKWINDFAAARNASFEPVKTDFVMWMDGDDRLNNRDGFIQWRNHAMQFGDFHLATYNYALDANGAPLISFARERVFKTSIEPKWKYFIHEGVTPSKSVKHSYVVTWAIDHHRTVEDQVKDKSRNLIIFEEKMKNNELDARMKFYYGKELYENKQADKAIKLLMEAATLPDSEPHDRLLAIQYACYSIIEEADKLKPEFAAEKLIGAIQLAHQGLQLEPTRAEFNCILGDCYLKMQKLAEALVFFAAAEHSLNNSLAGSKYAGPVFSYKQMYQEYPVIQKAKIYYHLQMLDKAEEEARKAHDKYNSFEAKMLIDELERIKPLILMDGPKEKVDEIVFTCPPQNAYPFDEELYKTKPMGGSETALIEMAKYLAIKTKKPVKVFNQRDSKLKTDSGVEYISNAELNEYMSKFEPTVHIAWRHNIKITNAPTYLWCHDLVTPGCEQVQNFDYMLCLTPFHKDYVQAIQGINPEKIIVTRNGVPTEKFQSFTRKEKNPNKIVWLSSPDRGLERAIKVIDLAKETHPDLELHVYYGLDNLYKYGLAEMADRIKKQMATRPWIKYHGFTEQSKMHEEVSDAVVWLHPCDFIETFCITALEVLLNGIYPVTRRLGGLKDTLKKAEESGMATMLDHDCVSDSEFLAYRDALISALDEKKWLNVNYSASNLSWSDVCEEWLTFLPMK